MGRGSPLIFVFYSIPRAYISSLFGVNGQRKCQWMYTVSHWDALQGFNGALWNVVVIWLRIFLAHGTAVCHEDFSLDISSIHLLFGQFTPSKRIMNYGNRIISSDLHDRCVLFHSILLYCIVFYSILYAHGQYNFNSRLVHPLLCTFCMVFHHVKPEEWLIPLQHSSLLRWF